MLPDLHEVEKGIVSEEKVKESKFTAGDVLKLIVAEMVTRQELRVVPASKHSHTVTYRYMCKPSRENHKNNLCIRES